MIEAYAIGVNLSLRGNVGTELAAVARQFENLNKIISQTKGAINELGAGMGAVARQARSAAQGWQNAASQMRAAARAAQDAAAAMARVSTPPAASAARAASPSNMLRISPPAMPLLLTGPGGGSGRGGALALTNSGTFAGGPGTGSGGTGLTVPPGGGGGGGGGIPLNLGPPLPRVPQFPKINQADAFVGAQGFGMLGDLLIGATSAIFAANKEINDRLSVMGNAGFTPDQLKRAQQISRDVQQNVPGITQAQSLHIMHDLFTVTQNANEATDQKLVSDYAKAGVVLESVGKSDAIAELFKAMQSGELRGAFINEKNEVDAVKAKGFLDNVLGTANQTGGRIGPSEILQIVKSSGLSAGMMDDKTLFAQMIAPALSLGPAAAGRGMQAFASQFVAGKMSDAAVKLMLRMKLIENLPANAGSTPGQQFDFLKPLYKTGIGQWALPQNMMPYRNNPNLNPAEHPIDFMREVLLPAMDAYNEKQNGKPRDDKDRNVQRQALALALSSRIPAGNVLGDVLRNIPLIVRDEEAIEKGLKRGSNDGFFNHLQETNPSVRMEALSAALNGLLVALGGPAMDSAMKGMRELTGALNALGDFATAHPDLSKGLVEYGFKLGLFSIGISTLGTALAVIPSMARLTGLAWGILTFGTSISAMPLATLTALPGAMRAFGAAAIALRATLLLGAGVGIYQGLKNTLFPGLDMHEWMLEHVPGAQGINRLMNGLTGGRVGDSEEDMRRQYPELNKGGDSGTVPKGRGGNAIPPAQNPFLNPISYRPPPVQMEQKLEINVKGEVDGRTLLSFVAEKMLRSGAGPSGGSTGFDQRTVYSGGMAA